MVNPKPGLVESLNGIVRNTAPVFCGCRRDRIAHRRAADESDLSPVALDNDGLSRFGEIAAAAPAHDASLIQDVQATQKRI
jgi:hypothetical protein